MKATLFFRTRGLIIVPLYASPHIRLPLEGLGEAWRASDGLRKPQMASGSLRSKGWQGPRGPKRTGPVMVRNRVRDLGQNLTQVGSHFTDWVGILVIKMQMQILE